MKRCRIDHTKPPAVLGDMQEPRAAQARTRRWREAAVPDPLQLLGWDPQLR